MRTPERRLHPPYGGGLPALVAPLLALSLTMLAACPPTPRVTPASPVEQPLPPGARLVPLKELVPHIQATIEELRLIGSWSRTDGQWVFVGVAPSEPAPVGEEDAEPGSDEAIDGVVDDATGEVGGQAGGQEDAPTIRHIIRATAVRDDASRLTWLVGTGEDDLQRDRELEDRVHARWSR